MECIDEQGSINDDCTGAVRGIASARYIKSMVNGMKEKASIPRKLVVAAAALLISAATAYASPITIDGNYTATYTSKNGNGPNITDDLGNPFSANLNLNTPVTTNLITVSPSGSCGLCGHSNTASGTINLGFTFTTPSGATGDLSDTGTYTADYSNDTDSVDWSSSNNPMTVDFSDGAVLSITLNNASDWAITPTVTFDLTNGPTQSVPEPTSLALFGTALAGLGLFAGMRRRRTL